MSDLPKREIAKKHLIRAEFLPVRNWESAASILAALSWSCQKRIELSGGKIDLSQVGEQIIKSPNILILHKSREVYSSNWTLMRRIVSVCQFINSETPEPQIKKIAALLAEQRAIRGLLLFGDLACLYKELKELFQNHVEQSDVHFRLVDVLRQTADELKAAAASTIEVLGEAKEVSKEDLTDTLMSILDEYVDAHFSLNEHDPRSSFLRKHKQVQKKGPAVLLALKKAFGKTEGSAKFLKKARMKYGVKNIAVTSTISLTHDLAHTFGNELYSDPEFNSKSVINGIATTNNSVHVVLIQIDEEKVFEGTREAAVNYLAQMQFDFPYVLMIDEISQSFLQYTNSTFDPRERKKALHAFKTLEDNAVMIIGADDDLRDHAASRYAHVRPTIEVLHDRYKGAGRYVHKFWVNPDFTGEKTIEIYHRNELFNQIAQSLDNNKKVAIFTDCKQEVHFWRSYAESAGKEVIDIHGDDKEHEDEIKRNCEFLSNVDAEIFKYQVLIYSPSISGGVSIKSFKFDEVFGIYSGVSISHAAFLQMAHRARANATIKIGIGCGFNREMQQLAYTAQQDIADAQEKTNELNKILNDSVDTYNATHGFPDKEFMVRIAGQEFRMTRAEIVEYCSMDNNRDLDVMIADSWQTILCKNSVTIREVNRDQLRNELDFLNQRAVEAISASNGVTMLLDRIFADKYSVVWNYDDRAEMNEELLEGYNSVKRFFKEEKTRLTQDAMRTEISDLRVAYLTEKDQAGGITKKERCVLNAYELYNLFRIEQKCFLKNEVLVSVLRNNGVYWDDRVELRIKVVEDESEFVELVKYSFDEQLHRQPTDDEMHIILNDYRMIKKGFSEEDVAAYLDGDHQSILRNVSLMLASDEQVSTWGQSYGLCLQDRCDNKKKKDEFIRLVEILYKCLADPGTKNAESSPGLNAALRRLLGDIKKKSATLNNNCFEELSDADIEFLEKLRYVKSARFSVVDRSNIVKLLRSALQNFGIVIKSQNRKDNGTQERSRNYIVHTSMRSHQKAFCFEAINIAIKDRFKRSMDSRVDKNRFHTEHWKIAEQYFSDNLAEMCDSLMREYVRKELSASEAANRVLLYIEFDFRKTRNFTDDEFINLIQQAKRYLRYELYYA